MKSPQEGNTNTHSLRSVGPVFINSEAAGSRLEARPSSLQRGPWPSGAPRGLPAATTARLWSHGHNFWRSPSTSGTARGHRSEGTADSRAQQTPPTRTGDAEPYSNSGHTGMPGASCFHPPPAPSARASPSAPKTLSCERQRRLLAFSHVRHTAATAAGRHRHSPEAAAGPTDSTAVSECRLKPQ